MCTSLCRAWPIDAFITKLERVTGTRHVKYQLILVVLDEKKTSLILYLCLFPKIALVLPPRVQKQDCSQRVANPIAGTIFVFLPLSQFTIFVFSPDFYALST